ncbi:SDR family oxidoreductase [Mitsuaria sp. WAJ17]|uniref:SDR family oxidoreductase n=1 Tax=Mitsuaria sp. WAJ17 TaxID=2761452 RepID=UPI0016025C81|nr:SDR family oxidoreductase [Mitsuaria sp. WAJ17]
MRSRSPNPEVRHAAARPRLLIVGCGDVGMRVLRSLPAGWQIYALTSSPSRHPALRAAGAIPLSGNLDDARSLRRLAGLATHVLHLAPPPASGAQDLRTRRLLLSLRRAVAPRVLVYASTTGVYGDAQGAWLDETAPLQPRSDRARRRVDAERALRVFGRETGTQVSVLRVPGIYAWDREGGHPRERLARGTPVLEAADDVYTNHIHADDLARVCVRALLRAPVGRCFNVCDDSQLRMGDYFDLAADLCGLPRPPRISREQARLQMSPMQLSFMAESRRLRNDRMKRELGLMLRFADVREGLLAGR